MGTTDQRVRNKGKRDKTLTGVKRRLINQASHKQKGRKRRRKRMTRGEGEKFPFINETVKTQKKNPKEYQNRTAESAAK